MILILVTVTICITGVSHNPNDIVGAGEVVFQSIGPLVAFSGEIPISGTAQIKICVVDSTPSSSSKDIYHCKLQSKEVTLRYATESGWFIEDIKCIGEWKEFQRMPTTKDAKFFTEFLRKIIIMGKARNDMELSSEEYYEFMKSKIHPEFSLFSFHNWSNNYSDRMKHLLRVLPAKHIALFCSCHQRRMWPIIWTSKIDIDVDFVSGNGIHTVWSEIIQKSSLEDIGKTTQTLLHFKLFNPPVPRERNHGSFRRSSSRRRKEFYLQLVNNFQLISFQRNDFVEANAAPLLSQQ